MHELHIFVVRISVVIEVKRSVDNAQCQTQHVSIVDREHMLVPDFEQVIPAAAIDIFDIGLQVRAPRGNDERCNVIRAITGSKAQLQKQPVMTARLIGGLGCSGMAASQVSFPSVFSVSLWH